MPDIGTSLRGVEPGANAVLSRLSAGDLRLLEPHLETVKLPAHKRLETPGRRIDHVYFIEHGLASVIARAPAERAIEIGLVGCEGMSGVPVVLGADRSPNEMVMLVGGTARCMRADNLRRRLRESRTLHAALLRYAYAFTVQIGQTAHANGRSNIEARVSRWLLMANDRLAGDAVPLTHEMLAVMLGVRRPGITVALKRLERRGLIHTNRRAVHLVDRDGLVKAASGAYGVAEAEYRRIFGR